MEIPSWFIAGKAAIWLALPVAWGIWELRRHRKMMAEDRAKAEAARMGRPKDATAGSLRSQA